jgi:hypothetical protein
MGVATFAHGADPWVGAPCASSKSRRWVISFCIDAPSDGTLVARRVVDARIVASSARNAVRAGLVSLGEVTRLRVTRRFADL